MAPPRRCSTTSAAASTWWKCARRRACPPRPPGRCRTSARSASATPSTPTSAAPRTAGPAAGATTREQVPPGSASARRTSCGGPTSSTGSPPDSDNPSWLTRNFALTPGGQDPRPAPRRTASRSPARAPRRPSTSRPARPARRSAARSTAARSPLRPGRGIRPRPGERHPQLRRVRHRRFRTGGCRRPPADVHHRGAAAGHAARLRPARVRTLAQRELRLPRHQGGIHLPVQPRRQPVRRLRVAPHHRQAVGRAARVRGAGGGRPGQRRPDARGQLVQGGAGRGVRQGEESAGRPHGTGGREGELSQEPRADVPGQRHARACGQAPHSALRPTASACAPGAPPPFTCGSRGELASCWRASTGSA